MITVVINHPFLSSHGELATLCWRSVPASAAPIGFAVVSRNPVSHPEHGVRTVPTCGGETLHMAAVQVVSGPVSGVYTPACEDASDWAWIPAMSADDSAYIAKLTDQLFAKLYPQPPADETAAQLCDQLATSCPKCGGTLSSNWGGCPDCDKPPVELAVEDDSDDHTMPPPPPRDGDDDTVPAESDCSR